MWYIFPQLDGLASSPTSKHFSIKGVEEARAYLHHPVLGPRLLECAEAVVAIEGRSAAEIFGSPDDLKLRSSATLFAALLPPGSIFDRLIAKYYTGARDDKTLHLLAAAIGGSRAGPRRRDRRHTRSRRPRWRRGLHAWNNG